jgi:thiamine-phosphate pyrophosphorylase
MSTELSGLYAITDEVLTPDETVLSQVERALKSGVKIIQYRNKNGSDEEIEPIITALQNLCRIHGATLIVDDRACLVAKLGVDGLHIGKDDISYAEARGIVGEETIIGVSCYGSLSRAKTMQEVGANYVAFGSLYPSPTKPHSGIIKHSVVKRAMEELDIPVCVIGGISQDNIDEVWDLGVDMVSVVSAIFEDDAIEERIEKLQRR